MIKMADGSFKRVDQINKGDKVASGINGTHSAKVLCLLRSTCVTGKYQLCTMPSGLKVTGGHPIFYEGEWKYPRDISKAKDEPCDAIYNLIID